MIYIKNKKIILPAVVLVAISGFGILGISLAHAQTTTGNYPPIVQRIADKFGLQVNEVQTVFDQEKTDRKQAMQVRFEQILEDAITAGKLTEQQKQLILDKQKEIQAKRLGTKESLTEWAKQNNIDLKYFFMGHTGPKENVRGGWHMN